ncbi:VWA domain-containing protein [Winogradskyella sp. 3972H.M.0a.05]|uniref:VWA domain-containing protein n=1 Tax=Winogradskyella sp. 3972H.M.0a.05 TaxID=2950277 RepID=UPI00339372C3
MATDTLLYIIIAGIIALSLALFQYIYKTKKTSRLYIILAFFRFLSIFAILLLLINPKFEQTSFYNEKPNLIVAVDNSESVSYLNQESKVDDLLNGLRSNETLSERFNIEYYSFGNEMNQSDSLSFNESQSNLSTTFNRLSEVYEGSISPVLFITDGNQTYGNDYEFAAKRYKDPIYPVVLGDTVQYADLKIQQLNVNKYAYLKNKFPTEVIAVYNGEEPITTEFRIRSGSATVFSKNLQFNKDNTSQIITANLPANRVGVRTYVAELVPLQNEKNKINNAKNFAVEVIDQKTNVAVVSDISHPDLGALKKSIEHNEQRQADIIKPNDFLRSADNYQMVILYQPNNAFRQVFDVIDQLKLNSFIITGTKTNWSLINGIQSNYLQEITSQSESFQPTLNINYSTFIVEDLGFDDYPPLDSEFGELRFSIPFETILYKTINGNNTNEPLLATFESNQKREAILFGEGIWKWRAQDYINNNSFEDFDDFLGKLIQYLGSDQKRSRLNVDYESFYNGNDNVIISAQYFNKNYEFDSGKNLNITLKNKADNATSTIPFILKNNSYEVDLSGISSGEYSFTVSVNDENISRSGSINILDYNVEQQFLNANVTKLRRVATNSDGQSYFIDNTSQLANDLLSDKRFSIIQKSNKNIVPLIDFKYLLALIAISLALEWFMRKYNGLI